MPFLWGAATAGIQVEGGAVESDWHHFAGSGMTRRRVKRLGRLAGTTLQLEPPGQAAGHWDLAVLADDLDRAHLLGLTAYRLSLEWSRLQPRAPRWATEAIARQREIRAATRAGADLRRKSRLVRWWDRERAQRLTREAAKEQARVKRLEQILQMDALEPVDPGEFDEVALAHYEKMVALIQSRGLTVLLTLNHVALPAWVLTPPASPGWLRLGVAEDEQFHRSLRGWENPVTALAFERFVRFVAPRFRETVSYWLTLNEPIGSLVTFGYLAGVWSPGFLADGERARRAYFTLIDAHVRAYDAIKEVVGTEARVGVGHAAVWARPAPKTGLARLLPGSNRRARDQWDYAFNTYFLDAVVRGEHNERLRRADQPRVRAAWRGKLDFIGLQYYRALDIVRDPVLAARAPWAGGRGIVDARSHGSCQRQLCNDVGWPIEPEGLYHLLRRFHYRYHMPILITENGLAEAEDANRAAYMLAHLQQIRRALDDGVNVIGYIHWALVDTWEWAYGHLPAARYGLFSLEPAASGGDGPARPHRRRLTRGALALQYVATASQRRNVMRGNDDVLRAAVARFGAITAEGGAVIPPVRQANSLWQGVFLDGDGSSFRLCLSQLPDNAWLGMIRFAEGDHGPTGHVWTRLDGLSWQVGLAGQEELSFHHGCPHGGGSVASYRAVAARRDDAPSVSLYGRISVGATERRWVAEQVIGTGTWASRGGAPALIALDCQGSDTTSWRATFYDTETARWTSVPLVTRQEGNRCHVMLDASAYGWRFIGALEGWRLHGSVIPVAGGEATPWDGRWLDDDLMPGRAR